VSTIPRPVTREEVVELATEFDGADPGRILRFAYDRFGDRIVLTCSWQRQSSLLVHLVSTNELPVRIVELDTGLFFPETTATRDALVRRYGVEVETIAPLRSVAEQELDEGPALWSREPDRCCALRKVEPLDRALVGMDAWITGIRREQSPTRAGAMPFEWDEARGMVKVQPLVHLSRADVNGLIEANAIPFNPLHLQGYPSIGCMPCTRVVAAGEDERAGRWSGTAKTECGLHTRAPKAA
jgi:phosphoadenosine phosphosulfate reductase